VKCRSCGSQSFGNVIDLGLMPLVNNLLQTQEEPRPRWPLKVVFCRHCSLAQLTETPSPEAMFREYLYFSSQSQTMVEHAGRLVERFVKPGQNVVEIASNDGYLLRQAQARGARVLGVDPARNIADFASQRGIPTRCEFFDADVAHTIAAEWGHADVLFANNVLAHVPDPNELAAGIKRLLAEHGVAHIEVPYIRNMIDAGAFDTIYHEHHCYFSLAALKSLFERHNLRIADVELIDIHGGSLHLQLKHDADDSKAAALCEEERQIGLFDDGYYAAFLTRVEQLRQKLEQVMDRFPTIAAYGAAAKGIVLLNAFGLDADRIPWVADVSPHKQGRFVPGTLQPIVPPSMLTSDKPAAALLLPWNITDEIIRRNRDYLDQGGTFIVPIPEVRLIGK